MEKETLRKQTIKTYEQKIRKKYTNYKWLLYFSLGGLSVMFLSLTFLYFISHLNSQQRTLKIEPVFYWNTLILLASSLAVIIAQKHYKFDNFHQYKTTLLVWLGLGILFLVGQICGWIVLFGSGFKFSHLSASYLYVISGIHAIHIIGGLIFLTYFTMKSWIKLNDYATSVVYFTDPVAQSQLKLFGIFWHFLGVMWLYLLLFFMLIG
jgi:cytochrome c oxidase subunit 3